MTNSKETPADPKAERLAAALRANLRLRKAQAKTIETQSPSLQSEQPKK